MGSSAFQICPELLSVFVGPEDFSFEGRRSFSEKYDDPSFEDWARDSGSS